MVVARRRFRRFRRKRVGKVPKKVRRYVKRTLARNIENKVIIKNGLPQPVLSAGLYIPLNTAPEGTGNENERLGTKIKMKTLWISFHFSINPAAIINTGFFYRLTIIYDRQPNGSAPSGGQLFSNNVTGQVFRSPFNVNGVPRFTILYDTVRNINPMILSAGATNANGTQVQSIRRRFFLKNLKTVYNTGNTGLIADINTGSLYVFLAGDTSDVQVAHSTQLEFEDA